MQPSRAAEARRVVEMCATKGGFFASAGSYRELWLRDMVYSEDTLLRLGHAARVRNHLDSFLRHQRGNGQLPTVLSSGWRRALNQRFHSWTSDTEPLFLIGAHRYASTAGDPAFLDENRGGLARCLRFVEGKLSTAGLIPGSDWRDAVVNYERKFLLSNQVLLAEMYEFLGIRESARRTRETVRDVFYLPDEGYLADCVWWEESVLTRESRLDCLGNAMAITSGLLTGREAQSVATRFEISRTPYGYTNMAPPISVRRTDALRSAPALNYYVRNGAFLRNRPGHYQNSAIWPFVEARMVAALHKAGLDDTARDLAATILNRRRFNEWYSPASGAPRGSRDQLWTAAAVLEQTSNSQD